MSDKLLFSLVGECHNGESKGVRMLDLFEKEGANSFYFKCRNCEHTINISSENVGEIVKHE